MTREAWCEFVGDDELLFMDGFDEAIIGVAGGAGDQEPRLVYDSGKVIEILMLEMDGDYHEACDYFSFNVAGSYVGPRTPVLLMRPEVEEDDKEVQRG